MLKSDLVIINGHLVDPLNGRDGYFDISIENGVINKVDKCISCDTARNVYNAQDMLVMPGFIDVHVHLTFNRTGVGFGMLAKNGITCALDCAGFVGDVISGLRSHGSGITVAVLNRLDPGVNISGPNANLDEISKILDQSLSEGALGFKLIGGHFPLTPQTTGAAIEAVNRAGAYVAFHCGTTENGSNIDGFFEAIELTGSNRIQLCHINAYCRGLTHGSPAEEALIALKALDEHPHIVSESHNAVYNSCSAALMKGIPRSQVTQTCLKSGGFSVNRSGLLEAAESGYLLVQKPTLNCVEYLGPSEGVDFLINQNFDVIVSFPVNDRSTAFLMSTMKNNKGRFIVNAISSDGGELPRNFLISHGFSLVKFNALTLVELVEKCSLTPSRMLGLFEKGHLGEGADADLVVIDPLAQKAVLTISEGKIVMMNDLVVGSGGKIATTHRGVKALHAQNIPAKECFLEKSLFYIS